MESLLLFLADYGLLLIIATAFIDEFFLTGYFLHGLALIGSVAMLYTTGLTTVPQILIGACIGTVLASFTNFTIGYFFSKRPYVEKITAGRRIVWMRERLERNGMFVFILVCRFVTITRPIYALLLGTLRVPTKRFVAFEIIIAPIWISFWTTILIFGTEAILKIT